MEIDVGRFILVLSRVRGAATEPSWPKPWRRPDMELAGVIPDDPEVSRLDGAGLPVSGLTDDSAARRAVGKIMDGIIT